MVVLQHKTVHLRQQIPIEEFPGMALYKVILGLVCTLGLISPEPVTAQDSRLRE